MSKAVAEILWAKARGDFAAAVVLTNADPPIGDEAVGLHLQQAAEKATKALLTWKNIKYPFTHDLHALLRLLTEGDCVVPEPFLDLDTLTPFATQARYERVVPPGSFDRSAFLDLVREFLDWTVGAR